MLVLARWNVPLVLIAVDTLAAGAAFQDENSNSEGQRAMNLLTQLAVRFRCCAMGLPLGLAFFHKRSLREATDEMA